MDHSCNRREFMEQVAVYGAAASLLPNVAAADKKPPPKAPDHTLTVIAGKPRERGRQYGQKFKDSIHAFLDREIYAAFSKKGPTKDDMLRYAGRCSKAIKDYSPTIADEMEGMAEGSGLRPE